MAWDIQGFIQKLQGGFESGQLKRDEEEAATMEQQKIAQEGANGELKQAASQNDLEYKKQKNQLDLIQKLVKIFDSGKKKKNPDGTEIDEPNPILELLKGSLNQVVSGYTNPVENVSANIPTEIPQEYTPEPQVDPYNPVTPKKNSVSTTTNDIVGNISDGGKDYMNSGNLEDYLKRYLQ